MHTSLRPALVAGVMLVAFAVLARGAETTGDMSIPPAAEILARLRTNHPRLLVSPTDLERLGRRVQESSLLGGWHKSLRERGDKLLGAAPSKYEIPDGLRLLSVSRRVVDRVYTLAWLFHLESDPRYAQRAWVELEAAAAFPDWNPRHFLDTAEMTHAFAIGYDWLFDFWTPEQRARLQTAMVEKGLKPALEIHRRGSGWPKARHNWNQVCNGGISLGALALADVEPALAGELLRAALVSIQLPMREYGPDGAWAEGPGYWRYATQYNVVFLAALETALGTDFGLSGIPGFSEAGLFPIYATGPLNRTFNYADASDGAIRSPEMFWLARRFARPEYAHHQASLAQALPLDLVWCDPAQLEGQPAVPALDRYFRAAEVVTLRSAWNDRNALFVGFKAGDNKANHSNLDLGSFVLDALGIRWAVDLGGDDYNLPGYFGGQRWTYYRLRAEGHNTLLLDPGLGPDQVPTAAAKIARFETTPNRAFAIADLSAAYGRPPGAVRRGIAMLDRRQVLVQDELRLEKPAELWWSLHTPATVELADDGRTATLRLDGRRFRAVVLEPAGAGFVVRDPAPLPTSPRPEKQNPNRGIRNLAIHLPGVSAGRLAVWLQPLPEGSGGAGTPPAITDLAAW